VRKIISILIALGLVLAFSVIATPVAAKVTGPVAGQPPQVDIAGACACMPGVYNITFNTTASLTEGVHCICIKFAAGTTFHPYKGAWKSNYILVSTDAHPTGESVFPSEITVTGTEVCFLVPSTISAGTVLVQFTSLAGVLNPCTPGIYKLEVKTCRAPDNTYVLSEPYTIVPCMSSYVFVWDSSPTYPGIAKGFVPPFKVCGQNETTGTVPPVEFSTGVWGNAFNITFMANPQGCNAPCETVDILIDLTASPQFPCAAADPALVTLNFTGASTLNTTVLYLDPCTDPDGLHTEVQLAADLPLTAGSVYTWTGLIHFNTVGQYTICFSAVCPGAAAGPCQLAGTAESDLVKKCYDFKVYQWKDAGKIILDEKWNLISLPLVPFDTSIATLLGSLPSEAKDADGASDLVSIWSYDRCTDKWATYGSGQTSLATMVDGKSYWVRMTYPMPSLDPVTGYPTPGNYTWWVWGTKRAMPPAAPSAYAMCPGWNMFGFTSLLPTMPAGIGAGTYLWNFGTSPLYATPLVFGWDNTGDWTTSGWDLITIGVDNLETGQGYWGAFPTAATIIPQ
jgi:hypothetical protein